MSTPDRILDSLDCAPLGLIEGPQTRIARPMNSVSGLAEELGLSQSTVLRGVPEPALIVDVPADMDLPVRNLELVDTDSRALARLIGATYVEMVRTPIEGVWLVVDEEGLYAGVPKVNRRVAGILYPGRIVGDVLIVGTVETDEGPDIGPLTALQRYELLARGILPEGGGRP